MSKRKKGEKEGKREKERKGKRKVEVKLRDLEGNDMT